MDEWDEPIEETGAFDRQNEEGSSSADPGWKDELNLAEFPIAALTDRIPDGQTTMVFEDRLEQRDSSADCSPADDHGDSQAWTAYIAGRRSPGRSDSIDQKAKQFHRCQGSVFALRADRALGWPQSGQSYRRIEEALHRWVGVVLMYENAWWDNQARSWVDEQFHVLDNVTLYDRERWRTSVRSGKSAKAEKSGSKADKPPLPLSSFRWNEVIFRSFQSGNLKQLDLEFYLKLRLPTTKRMYRFLDKRFYRRSRLDFDLRTLACEHIGLSRSYAPTELKRRLKPALEEMEQLGFLEPLGPEERYSYVKRGCWRIIFIRGRHAAADVQDPVASRGQQPTQLLEALKARGVASKTAQELVDAHPHSRINTKIEVFDWLLRNEDKRVGKNPAGYLVASIRSDYKVPGDYQTQTSAARAGFEQESAGTWLGSATISPCATASQ